MPIPKPKSGETKDAFISRCMSDAVMKKEFPEREQRLAVCSSQLKAHEESKMKLQHLTTNFSDLVRHDRMEGREYLVAPMIMAVEGVLNGSDGPLYYPAEEWAKVPAVWNHKPVVVYHPTRNGEHVSACDPDILTNRKVGVIMNTRWEDGKLKAEAWIEKERVGAVDPRVKDALEKNVVMELSTGLYVSSDGVPGEWKGIPYIGTARNCRPDHLALLPDKVGACSIADGAGFLRANAAWSTAYINDLPDSAFLYIESGGKKDEEGKTTPRSLRHLPYKDSSGKVDLPHLRNALARIPQMDISDQKKESLQKKARAILEKQQPATQELSHQAIKEALRQKVSTDKGSAVYVEDVFADTFIYEKNGELFRQNYSIKGDTVSVSGIPERVQKKYEYVVLDNEQMIKRIIYRTTKGLEMDKKEAVQALIDGGGWTEDDREFLMSLNDEGLKHLQDRKVPEPSNEENEEKENKKDEETEASQVQTNKEKEPVANQKSAEEKGQPKKPMTVDEYIANAPEGIQEVLRNGYRVHQRMRESLIKQIMAHERNAYTEEALQAKSMDDLQALAQICSTPESVAANDYSGLGPISSEHEEAPLVAPTMDFSTK